MIFGSSLRATVKKEISSDQNWKEAFCETAFRYVIATHRVSRCSSVFSLLTQFSGNLQWDNSERNEACDDKGNILIWKLERSFITNFLVMCEFITQRSTLPFLEQLLTLLSCVLQRDILELIEVYGEKGNNLRWKVERSLLRNCIAMCECNSQCYMLPFSDQFANTVFWKSAMWYFLAQWSLRWQRKYPQMKTRKKLC